MNNRIELKFGDLFAGAGGLSLGLIISDHSIVNYRPLFAIDNDNEALASYLRSMKWLAQAAPDVLPHLPLVSQRDIQDLNSIALLRLFKLKKGELDLLVGGPPCQGYSSANRQSTGSSKSDQNRLSKIFFDRLEELRPKMFLLENVQGVKWTDPTPEMEAPMSQLSLFSEPAKSVTSVQGYLFERAKALGYYTWHRVLNAVDFGVPQTRYRFFLFGVRTDIATSGSDVVLDNHLDQLKTEKVITVNEAIGDLPNLQNGQVWTNGLYEPGSNPFIQQLRRFMPNGELHDHITTKHADYVIERYKKIPEGKNWEAVRELMSNYSKVDNTHSNIYRRLRRDAPAITISHYRKSMIIHPTQDRGISFREACRLQSFPDWYRFSGGIDHCQQQLANAVPPLLASKIAHAIADCWLKITNSHNNQDSSEPS